MTRERSDIPLVIESARCCARPPSSPARHPAFAATPAYARQRRADAGEPASENAQAIYDSYILILFVTGFVFVVVEATLLVFIVRYRRGNRAREGEGPQVRGHTRIEVAWTIVPVVLLAIIVAFVFVKLPEIEDAPAAGPAGSIDITVEGHQYYWLYRYPGGEIAVDELVVPVNKVVNLEVSLRTSSTAGGSRRSAARSTPFPAARTTRGSRPSGRGRSRAAAPSSAARSTPI